MPETAPILYLGDTALNGAAAYLGGVMHHASLAFDYCPSDTPIGDKLQADRRELIILSDYPAAMLTQPEHEEVVAAVHAGTGLAMLGGWESYHGQGGDWQGTPVGETLPVLVSPFDDRVNFDQVALLRPVNDHPILAGLPWDLRPPAIGGYNRFRAKADGKVVLEVVRRHVRRVGDAFQVASMQTDPMLVVGEHGSGRVVCLATDAAPHWVGPLVDWGTDNDPPSGGGRVKCQAPGAGAVEIGACYARFYTQLLTWAKQT